MWQNRLNEIENWEDKDPGAMKDVGIALVRLYNNTLAPAVRPQVGKDGIRGIEQKFEIKVGGVPMLGYIDLIDTNADVSFSKEELARLQAEGNTVPKELRTVVTDFKFKAKSMAQSIVEGSLQMTMYSLATGIYAIRYDQLLKLKKPKITRVTAMRTPQDHAWLSQVVQSVATSITKGSFPPCDPTNWVCSPKWCGYWHMCRGKKV
jgi:hypothetical protein